MSDLPLRAACIHGRYDDHWWPVIFPLQVVYTYTEGVELCPGGRDIPIDYEAAVEFANAIGLCADDEVENEPEPFADQVRWVIEVAITGETKAEGGRWLDAAIGDTDE